MKDDPAFPGQIKRINEDTIEVLSQGGLTKREYFAAMAMQGFASIGGTVAGKPIPEWMTQRSVELADALIAELGRGEP